MTLGEAGETFTLMRGTVTVLEPDLVESACKVADTVTVSALATVEGAVYRPVASTAPQALPVHPVPAMLQLTAVLVVPVTVALNCCVAPATTVTVAGETDTVIAGGAGDPPFAEAPQPRAKLKKIGRRAKRIFLTGYSPFWPAQFLSIR
jgi:hypothetical protein